MCVKLIQHHILFQGTRCTHDIYIIIQTLIFNKYLQHFFFVQQLDSLQLNVPVVTKTKEDENEKDKYVYISLHFRLPNMDSFGYMYIMLICN